jgi:hypothetical protein
VIGQLVDKLDPDRFINFGEGGIVKTFPQKIDQNQSLFGAQGLKNIPDIGFMHRLDEFAKLCLCLSGNQSPEVLQPALVQTSLFVAPVGLAGTVGLGLSDFWSWGHGRNFLFAGVYM